MDRTLRAALLAAVLIGGSVAGLGVFLGFEVGSSLVTAVICGALAALLLWGASRRAETFHPTDPDAHLAQHPERPAPPSDPPSDVTDPAATERPDDQNRGA